MAGERQRLNTLARLPLGEPWVGSRGHSGRLAAGRGHVPRLRQLGSRGDIIKRLHEGMRGRIPDPDRHFQQGQPTPGIDRASLRACAVDEIADDLYLLVEGRTARPIHVS